MSGSPSQSSTGAPNAPNIQLPGFNLPLSDSRRLASNGELFPSALNATDIEGGSIALPLKTLREFTMMRFMNQITDKVDWHKKIFNDDIVAKWKTEALENKEVDTSEKMVDWCIGELRYKSKIFEETGAVSVYDADVVKSDDAVPQELKGALKNAVKPLEDVPPRELDWHPGSGGKVLDLVHPSLFPVVFGRSRILPNGLTSLADCIERCGDGVVIPVPDNTEVLGRRYDIQKSFSKNFQWLPCDVDISGEEVKITSYINNLHPHKHKEIYSIVEKVIACAIPLWNMTLAPLQARYYRYHRIAYEEVKYEGGDEGRPKYQLGDDADAFEERLQEWELNHPRQAIKPEPEPFKRPDTVGYHDRLTAADSEYLNPERMVNLRRDYGEHGLQVIVKLANIHLTPDKPEYEGGTWHVEGQLNERICATALYYYDSENITTSHLAFRQQSNIDDTDDIGYEQDEHLWLTQIFGCEQDGPAVQYIGSVDTKEGRLVTFPNILQHQVQPFKLADPTKPGHRKILALFLVDPHIRIISTANVPCQRQDWWREKIGGRTQLEALPLELRDTVYKEVDFPISLNEARKLREELMDERRVFVIDHGKAFEAETFSLCEH
ncbi:hypothetical protein AX17_005286 [Amanita inopinata Kibby_2008]|nr:hypothetical protein AX17_005286 [Amanita inopinata Kibby_2008]